MLQSKDNFIVCSQTNNSLGHYFCFFYNLKSFSKTLVLFNDKLFKKGSEEDETYEYTIWPNLHLTDTDFIYCLIN